MSKNFASTIESGPVTPELTLDQTLGIQYDRVTVEAAEWVEQVIQMCFPDPVAPVEVMPQTVAAQIDELARRRAEVAAAFEGAGDA